MKKPDLSIEMVREALEQLKSADVSAPSFNIRDSHLTVDGVVQMGGCYMHPNSFKDIYGEEEYQLLLDRPRVASPYKDLDLDD